MDTKNNIKIKSFEVTRMYLGDISEVLRLAISNQNWFGVHPSSSPTVFLNEISKVLQQNTRLSFVFRRDNQIFGAFILQPVTSKSINFLYSFYDKKSTRLEDLCSPVAEKLQNLNTDVKYAFLLKKQKNAKEYENFLKSVGFKYHFNENDLQLIFSDKKA